MAEFENINSPSDRLTLEKEIQIAVAGAALPLLQTNSWRMYTGPQQEQLISQLGQLLGAKHVGLTCSGSAALEMLLRGCRLASGDEVLLSAYDYPGNFTAIENCGARPALVDVAPDSWNLSVESLEETWTPACKVLIASHLHGQLQDMHCLQQWCKDRQVLLIQDACQAIGASIGGQPLGQWGQATIVSFGGSKVISAGRGGAWCTNDDSLAQHVRLAAGVGSGAYELSELQAAMVLAQLPWLPRITEQCREHFSRQLQATNDANVIAPWAEQIESTAFYQAGWLLNDLQSVAQSASYGKGFDGFHRRSSRRCRRVSNLENAMRVAKRTITQHHRVALQY